MTDMPEPKTFTGAPGETGSFVNRSTGPRVELSGRCPVCGEDMPPRPFFGDPTCGEAACRDAWIRRPR